jgi:hypothetical protein
VWYDEDDPSAKRHSPDPPVKARKKVREKEREGEEKRNEE